ncbi:MAG: DUF4303 domain-containing protein [Planctomycetaceae bacterium]|jgi:hypothetical protein|nr:DUF4303 domain-containing protein [Planctomycetaceae bacterium]MBT6156501.1 DUF4303 domain-containing protein [Planctomycetaceae bacterium]MBT6485421.1 DUF4303 domain-containing protein [Planctomycetaceae bacterium]MBT6497217.1 DUF4303 domain-containing protein [Planctomycetaceae bacterium]
MDIDWNQFETLLAELTTREVEAFAASHATEPFYGFMFDCNSDYGQILLCLNTEAELQADAESAKEGNPDFDAEETLEGWCNSRRWNAGDWKYQGFNSTEFDDAWEPFETVVSDMCMDEEEDEDTFMTPTQDKFMKSVCRVLIRLDNTGIFDRLSKTVDFKTFVADHDELDSESWERLASVRTESAP